MAKDLVFEIGTEEIPARFMTDALAALKAAAADELEKERIRVRRVDTYGTPRRLVLFLRDVPDRQDDLCEEFKGPAWKNCFDVNGYPTRAAEGFAKSRGVDVSDLIRKPSGNVDYAFAQKSASGLPVEEVLPALLTRVAGKLVFPKNMFWSDPTVRFARPIRWILCLLGDKVIPVELSGVKSGRVTRGHRFMGCSAVEVPDAASYLSVLYDQSVIVDQEKRREKMLAAIASIERELGGTVELEDGLVEENLYLVEYPVPFAGKFDPKYLLLPEEVLITSMKVNQKYFPVRSSSGKLMAMFVGVSNNKPATMDLIREGNERVLRARLEDAAFFWQEDLKKPLSARLDGLKQVVYQEKLGSVYDKTQWMTGYAVWLADQLNLGAEKTLVQRAAQLSKTDLITQMVGEFPELQGVMGRAYAKENGEDPRVALALEEQYLPRSAGDKVPTDIVGALVGLAERIFSMVGAYKLGFRPSGSQDPYGLRRAVRCVNEILWALKIDLDMGKALDEACRTLSLDEEAQKSLREYVASRTFGQLKEQGFPHDLVALAADAEGSNPWQGLCLLKAYSSVSAQAWFAGLREAAGRVKNILAKAPSRPETVDAQLFKIDAEKGLWNAVETLREPIAQDVAECRWNDLMERLAGLAPAVAAFFDQVMVMDDDAAVRDNRLALLLHCDRLFSLVGDLSRAGK